MPVHFSFSEPSEGEYFEKYNQYNGKTLWFLLIFILRGYVPFCVAIQVGFFETPHGVNDFYEFLWSNRTSPVFYTSACNYKRDKDNFGSLTLRSGTILHVPKCLRENLVIEMSICRSFGFSLGGVIAGVLSDLFGRRPVSLGFSVFWFLFALVLVFIDDRMVFSVFFIFTSICCAAVNIVTFVTFAEIAKKRNRILSIFTSLTFSFGTIVIIYITRKLSNWTHLMAFNAANVATVIFCCWYLPESPRWLLNKYKKKEAYEHLEEITGLKYEFIDNAESLNSDKKQDLIHMFMHIFEHKLKYFFLFTMLMIINSLFYYAGRWQRVIHFVNTNEYALVHSLMDAASYLFILPLYLFFGKQHGLFFIYLMMSVISVTAIATQGHQRLVYFSVFSIFLGFAALNLYWLYVIDVFSTFIRNTVLGFYFTILGLMSIVAIILEDNIETITDVYYYLIFLIVAGLGIAVLFLPNTSKLDLPNYKLNY